MRKYIMLLCMLCIVGTFTGCGKESVSDSEENVLTEADFAAKEEILNCGTFKNKLQFGVDVIDIPCKLSVFLSAGAAITDDSYSADFLIDADTSIELPIDLYGSSFSAEVKNTNKTITKASECDVMALLHVASPLITFPKGVQAGVSTYDEVAAVWGVGYPYSEDTENTEANGEYLTYHYYRDGVSEAQVYAYEKGSISDTVMDIGGYKYCVTYNRNTGVITNIDAYFNQKKGTATWEKLNYIAEDGEVVFEILEDSYIADDRNDMTYCIETIDKREYIIGVGVGNVKFDRTGNFLVPDNSGEEANEEMQETTADEKNEETQETVEESVAETEPETEPETETEVSAEHGGEDVAGVTTSANQLAKEFLVFDEYDFSQDYTQNTTSKDALSYTGESIDDTVYIAVSAEIREKSACSIVYFMHPLDGKPVGKKAVEYMHSYILHTRETLRFKWY